MKVRYWDASAFLGYINEEDGRVDDCRCLLESAANGEFKIITSAHTLTEVIKKKDHDAIGKEKEQLILDLFEPELAHIVVVNFDRFLAEKARSLIWDHGLKSVDAIHVATALQKEVPVLNTYDERMLGLNGAIPQLAIEKPFVAQRNLPLS